jgi:hypothetical protein
MNLPFPGFQPSAVPSIGRTWWEVQSFWNKTGTNKARSMDLPFFLPFLLLCSRSLYGQVRNVYSLSTFEIFVRLQVHASSSSWHSLPPGCAPKSWNQSW